MLQEVLNLPKVSRGAAAALPVFQGCGAQAVVLCNDPRSLLRTTGLSQQGAKCIESFDIIRLCFSQVVESDQHRCQFIMRLGATRKQPRGCLQARFGLQVFSATAIEQAEVV